MLAGRKDSFVSSSRYSSAQTRSQYVPLKVACIKDVYLQFSKIRSLRHHQIVQHKADTPTIIYFFSFKSKFDSQLHMLATSISFLHCLEPLNGALLGAYYGSLEMILFSKRNNIFS
jgi:hypothetical protein